LAEEWVPVGEEKGLGVNKAQAAKESEQTFTQRIPSAPGG